MIQLSICIPTYNRATSLINCLQSIIDNNVDARVKFQVCVSDNGSTDHTADVVKEAQNKIDIKYHQSDMNLGRVKNYLHVVDMADGEFVWLLGDDDLLCPHAIEMVIDLINEYQDVDFFYINSFQLDMGYVESYLSPFSTVNLPDNMLSFSSWEQSGRVDFLDLINPKVSFDFLGGMFLAVFRRKNWLNSVSVLDQDAISDLREFSHFDNTFPHIKVFAKAFANSKAYFYAKALSVNLTGVREWAPMYSLVRSVRLLEALDEYKKYGLNYWHYLRCKNYALNCFIPDIVAMVIYRNSSGVEYVSLVKLLFENCLYPNFYLSPLNYCMRKVKNILNLKFTKRNYDEWYL